MFHGYAACTLAQSIYLLMFAKLTHRLKMARFKEGKTGEKYDRMRKEEQNEKRMKGEMEND